MFSIIDHLYGAVDVRLNRFFLKIFHKPDATFLDSNIYLGGVNKIPILSKFGITAILDLREEANDSEIELDKYSISYLRIKIKDRSFPSEEQTLQAINWIKSMLQENKKIFVHCNLGRGRAPLISCAYFLSTGKSSSDSVSMIKSKRRYVFLNKIQLKFLQNFEKKYFHK